MLGSKQAKEYFSGANTVYFLWEKDDPQRQTQEPKWVEPRAAKNHFSGATLGPNQELATCARLDFRTAVDQWLLCALNFYIFFNRSVNLVILSGFHHYM